MLLLLLFTKVIYRVVVVYVVIEFRAWLRQTLPGTSCAKYTVEKLAGSLLAFKIKLFYFCLIFIFESITVATNMPVENVIGDFKTTSSSPLYAMSDSIPISSS